jgi:hypothetical protein
MARGLTWRIERVGSRFSTPFVGTVSPMQPAQPALSTSCSAAGHI